MFNVLLITPAIINKVKYGHRFKMFRLVSEIHENVDLVLGIRDIFELEGIMEFERVMLKLLK